MDGESQRSNRASFFPWGHRPNPGLYCGTGELDAGPYYRQQQSSHCRTKTGDSSSVCVSEETHMTDKTKAMVEGAAMFCTTNALLLAVSLSCLMVAAPSASVAQEVLPFPPKPSGSIANRTMQESVYSPQPAERHLRADAPNILIVLIDDAGPGLPTTFGGEVNTPTLDRISKAGVTYNRFHTTAMCSPTRAALLTGRNHHRVGNGQITELANDWDGYSGVMPKSSATVAEVLRNYGYATGAGASGTTHPPS